MRNLILILGDQLDAQSAVFDDVDDESDVVWMAEVAEEATHVWSHKQRIVMFFSAMRHFRDELLEKNHTVRYHELTPQRSNDRGSNFAAILRKDIRELQPKKLVVVLPGDYRVKRQLEQVAGELDLPLEWRPDRHFYCEPSVFAEFAQGRKSLVMETFYRQMRKHHNVLMEEGEPAGGKWNYDKENRETFGKRGPDGIRDPHSFRSDEITEQVFDLVTQRFGDHPGSLEHFNLPVTHKQARTMLRDFCRHNLPLFGKYEDAMWSDQAFVYHSRLSAPLNLKLLNPRECVAKAIETYEAGEAPINSVEGFVRQLLGWREFIRGIYWLYMPEYADKNELDHEAGVPEFFWNGESDMICVQQSMQHVLRYGYAHHIHRLMVLGNLALLLGVHPRLFHEWHMAMYVDAVDWVSLPNALGMSQHADGGIVGTKPYVSTGNYINRMSNFCRQCPYDFKAATGDNACPFTTLYWDFLDRHHGTFQRNHRMAMQIKNVERKQKQGEMEEIRERARALKKAWLS